MKFAKNIVASFLIGKCNFHLEIIGNTSRNIINKIDQILINTARYILGKQSYGRGRKWIFNKMGWTNYYEMYLTSIQKMCHRILNSDDDHYYKSWLTNNRSVRSLANNKVGPVQANFGKSQIEHKTFLYTIINAYSSLPRELTLIKKPWIFRYSL